MLLPPVRPGIAISEPASRSAHGRLCLALPCLALSLSLRDGQLGCCKLASGHPARTSGRTAAPGARTFLRPQPASLHSPSLRLPGPLEANPGFAPRSSAPGLSCPPHSSLHRLGLRRSPLVDSPEVPSIGVRRQKSSAARWGHAKNVPAAEGSYCQKREQKSKWCPRA